MHNRRSMGDTEFISRNQDDDRNADNKDQNQDVSVMKKDSIGSLSRSDTHDSLEECLCLHFVQIFRPCRTWK